jgi:hypothetical protein
MPRGPIFILQERIEARALLLKHCEYDAIDEAFAPIIEDAIISGLSARIGMAEIERRIDAALKAVGLAYDDE